MDTVIGRFSPQVFAVFRIVMGVLFAFHGSQKILGWPPMGERGGGPLPPLLLVGGWIELAGGLLIAVGLFTGWAAFICSGEMAVAYFMAHASKGGPLPILNKGELAAVYSWVFLYIAAHGAGIWSLDSMMRRRTPVVTTA
ncbi:MAG: DoxX family protein [Acidobacteriota bacterium]|nr:DoxX family protein [Acidobacteriota bacterium]